VTAHGPALRMDGTALAARIVEETAQRAREIAVRIGREPCLAAVLVGDDPASVTYVRMKQRRSARAGIASRLTQLPSSPTKLWKPSRNFHSMAESMASFSNTPSPPMSMNVPLSKPSLPARTWMG